MSKKQQIGNIKASAAEFDSTKAALHVQILDSTGGVVDQGLSSTQVSIRDILTSSGVSVMDSSNNAVGVTIRAGSAAGTEYTDGDVDATPSGGAVFFDNGSNTMRVVSTANPLPVAASFTGSTQVAISSGVVQTQPISSSGVSLTTDTAPASTAQGLITRQVGYTAPSTGPLQISSVVGVVSVAQNSTVWAVQVGGYVAPSTTVQVSSVGGVVANQIIDRDASTQIAGVTNTTPASTAYGLVVREAATPSTGPFAISSIAGRSLVDQNSTVWVTQVSSVAGVVLNRLIDRDQTSNVAAVLNSLPASTVYALAVREVGGGGSTQVAISSGVVQAQPISSSGASLVSDAVPASTAQAIAVRIPAPVWDSTNNALRVFQAESSGGASSTQVAISSGVVQAQPISSSGASLVSDTVPASTAQAMAVRIPAPIWDSTNNALRVFQAESSGGASSTQVAISSGIVQVQHISSSGVSMSTDTAPASTAQGLIVRQVGYTAPSTGPLAISSIAGRSLVDQNSTVWVTQVSSVAGIVSNQIVDRDQSTQIAAVTNTTPDSTDYALVVREAAQSTGPFAISSIAGRTLVDQNSTVWVVQLPTTQTFQVKNSTIGDLLASVQQNSTTWAAQAAVFTSSGGGVTGSTGAPATNALGLLVRNITPGLNSTTVTVAPGDSTTFTQIVAGSGSLKHKAYAYFVGSDVTVASTMIFFSGTNADRWSVVFGSESSGITGANMAVSPPASIFETAAGAALNVRIESASTVNARLALSWFSEL